MDNLCHFARAVGFGNGDWCNVEWICSPAAADRSRGVVAPSDTRPTGNLTRFKVCIGKSKMKSLLSIAVAFIFITPVLYSWASDVKNAKESVEAVATSRAAAELMDLEFIEFNRRLCIASDEAEKLGGYTAILEMQEEINGELRSTDTIGTKFRRQPFSVYMHWNGNDQEALFVDGQNNNRMFVKPTRALMVIRRVWNLEPGGAMAMRTSRYPITDSGVERLTVRVVEFYKARVDQLKNLKCKVSSAKVGDRNVDVFELSFDDTSANPLYCRCRVSFDKATHLLIAVENFDWNADRSTMRLIEKYAYLSINPNVDLTSGDFDRSNPKYAFVKH